MRPALLVLLVATIPAGPLPSPADTRGMPELMAEEDWRRWRVLVGIGFASALAPEGFTYYGPDPGWSVEITGGRSPWVDVMVRLDGFDLALREDRVRAENDLPADTPIAGGRGEALTLSAIVGLRLHSEREGWRPFVELGIGTAGISYDGVSWSGTPGSPGSPGGGFFDLNWTYLAGAGVEFFDGDWISYHADVAMILTPESTQPTHVWMPVRVGVSIALPRLRS